MILDGLQIMVIGMSVVFLLLAFIVVSVKITSRVVSFLHPDGQHVEALPPNAPAPPGKGPVAAAISAAVALFRSERKGS
ncbi:MAG TPA: OadG family protein [bacterium]|nr:OadG family protein [bacterium]